MSEPLGERYMTNESVVLLATGVAPAMFNAKFLHDADVLAGVEELQAIRVPPLTQVTYDKGYVFEAVEGRLKLERAVQTRLTPDVSLDSQLQESAVALARNTRFLTVTAVGINFGLIQAEAELEVEEELRSQDWRNVGRQLQRRTDEFQLNVSVREAINEHGVNGVVMDCNFHFTSGESIHAETVSKILDERDTWFAQAKEVFDDLHAIYRRYE